MHASCEALDVAMHDVAMHGAGVADGDDDSRHLPGSCRRRGPQAAPCRLPPHLLGPAKLRYSLERWDLVAAARIAPWATATVEVAALWA